MSTAPRLALVLGASGGVGGETARALARRGWTIRALSRDPAKANASAVRAGDDWAWVTGDAMDRASVVAAAQGASIIVHAVNPPGYRNWGTLVVPMLDNSLAAARASGARVLLPGTVYNYGPDALPLVSEDSPQHPVTAKGALRVAMERRLEDAAAEGVRSLVLRAGDYFGPRPGGSWFSQGLIRPGRPVRGVIYPGRRGVGHSWAYLPDVAETFARLADREAELAPFERLHFAGHWDADGTKLIAAIARVVGAPRLRVTPLPWPLLSAMAPFNETVREMVKMKSLWRTSLQLDNRRLVVRLGAEPHTPLDQALTVTLRALGCLEAAESDRGTSHARSTAIEAS